MLEFLFIQVKKDKNGTYSQDEKGPFESLPGQRNAMLKKENNPFLNSTQMYGHPILV